MLYFISQTDGAIRATPQYDDVRQAMEEGREVVCRPDLKSFAEAEALASRANESADEGVSYLPVDAGSHVSPRYDVIEAPRVGQEVSYSFNSDSYPDGQIVSVGSGIKMVVTTSTGNRYFRRRLSGTWIKQGGTWSMIQGHVNERNPSF